MVCLSRIKSLDFAMLFIIKEDVHILDRRCVG